MNQSLEIAPGRPRCRQEEVRVKNVLLNVMGLEPAKLRIKDPGLGEAI